MRYLFEVIDPRGRTIVCTTVCWAQHILNKHDWMKGRKADVMAALETPDAIYQDVHFPNRESYYLQVERVYMKVVVEFDSGTSGSVVTAFPTANAKPGERLLWSASNP